MELQEIKKTLESNLEQIKKTLEEKTSKTDADIVATKSQVEELKKAIASLEDNIKAFSVSDRGLNEEVKKEGFSISKLIKVQLLQKSGESSPWEKADACKEQEMIKETKTYYEKVGLLSDGSNLGYLIPPQYSKEIIEMAVAEMPVFNMGINKIDNLVSDLYLPKETGLPTAYYVGEIGKPTKSDASVGQLKLSPHKVGSWVQLSNTIAKNVGASVDKYIEEKIVKSMRLKMHEGIVKGTGVDKEVKGILNYSGLNDITAASASRFIIDKLAQMYWTLKKVNEIDDMSKLGFLMNPVVLEGLCRERVQMFSGQAVGTGMPVNLATMLLNPKVLKEMIGYDIASSTHVPTNYTLGASTTASPVVFGDWSKLILGTWKALEVKVTDIYSLPDDIIDFVAFFSFDVACAKESSFVISKDAESTTSSWTIG